MKCRIQVKRDTTYIEFLRIIAILLVIFNHTGDKGFFLFSISTNSIFYWFYLFISISCKIAVPLFFMISGALLIPKDESIKMLFKKRIIKFIIIILVFSFIQYIYYSFIKNQFNFSVSDFIVKTYSLSMATAYWYLYSYLGLLLMLPFIRKMARNMNKNEYIYLAFMQIIFIGVLPILEYIFTKGNYTLNSSFSAPIIICSNIFYFTMGNYFENIFEQKNYTKITTLLLSIVSFACILISCLMTNYRSVITKEFSEGTSQSFHMCLIAIPTFTTFFLVKYLFQKISISARINKIITTVGSCTFGIMLFENIFRENEVFIFHSLNPYIRTLPACITWVFAIFLSALLLTLILKYVPIIKKLL